MRLEIGLYFLGLLGGSVLRIRKTFDVLNMYGKFPVVLDWSKRIVSGIDKSQMFILER